MLAAQVTEGRRRRDIWTTGCRARPACHTSPDDQFCFSAEQRNSSSQSNHVSNGEMFSKKLLFQTEDSHRFLDHG